MCRKRPSGRAGTRMSDMKHLASEDQRSTPAGRPGGELPVLFHLMDVSRQRKRPPAAESSAIVVVDAGSTTAPVIPAATAPVPVASECASEPIPEPIALP